MLINKNLEINNVKYNITGIEENEIFIPNLDTSELKNIILPIYNYKIFSNSIVLLTEANFCKKNIDGKFFIYNLNNYEKLNILDISNLYLRVESNINILNILNNLNNPKFIIIILNDIFLNNKRILEIYNNEIIFEDNVLNNSDYYLGLRYKDDWPLNVINTNVFSFYKNDNLGIKKIEGTKDYKSFRFYSNYKNNTDDKLYDFFIDIDLNNNFINHNFNKIVGIDINSGKMIKNIVGDEIKKGKIKKIELVNDYNNFIINNFNKNCIKINNNRFKDVINFRGKVKKVYILDSGNNYSENPYYELIPSRINEKYIPPKFKFIIEDEKIKDVIIVNTGDYISGDLEIKVYDKNNNNSAKIKLFIEGPIIDIDPLYIDYYFEEIKKIEFEFGNGAILKPVIINGRIENINIINSGEGYFNFPEIEFVSNNGIGAFAVVKSINSLGGIKDIEILDKGRNYEEDTIISLKNKNYNKLIKSIELDTYNKIYNDFDDKYITQYSDNYSLSKHGKLVGISLDGHPIYIGVGYSDPLDSSSPLKKISNSYSIDQTISSDLVQSFYYTGLGDLDENNGRFCVTPEFPEGVYAYFITENEPKIPLKLKYSVKSYDEYVPIFINNKINKHIDFSYKNRLIISRIISNLNFNGNIGESLTFNNFYNDYKIAEIEYNKIKNVTYDFLDLNKIKLNSIDKKNNEYLIEFHAKEYCPIIFKKILNKLYILDGIIFEDIEIIDNTTTDFINKDFLLFFINNVLQDKNLDITINHNNIYIDNLIPNIDLFLDKVFYFYLENIGRDEFILSSDTYVITVTNTNFLIFINGIIQYNFLLSSNDVIFSDILKSGDKISIIYLNDPVFYDLYIDPSDFYIKNSITNNYFNISDYNFIIIKNNIIQNPILYSIENDNIGYKINDLNLDLNDNVKVIGVKNLNYRLDNLFIKKRVKIYLRDNLCNPVTDGAFLFVNGVFQENYNLVDNYLEIKINQDDKFLIYYVPGGALEFISNYTGPLFYDKLTFINGVFQNYNNYVINENIVNFVCNDIIRDLYLNNDIIYSSVTNTPFDQIGFNFLLFINNVIQDVDFEYDYNLNYYKLTTQINLSSGDTCTLVGIKNLQKIKTNYGFNFIDLNKINRIHIFKPHIVKFKKPINFKTDCRYEEDVNYYIIDSKKNNDGIYTILLDNYKINLIILRSPVYNYGIRVDHQTILLKNIIIPPISKYFDINIINLSKESPPAGECHFKVLDENIEYNFYNISHNDVDLEIINNNFYYPIRKHKINEFIPNCIPIIVSGLLYINTNKDLKNGDIIKFDYKNNTYTGVVLDDRFKTINIYGIKPTTDFKLNSKLITNVIKIG